MKKFLLTVVLSVLLTGCHTMHFTQNGQVGNYATENTQKMHHQFIFELIEGSDPVNASEYCKNNQWQSTKTEISPFNALIRLGVSFIPGGAIAYAQTSAAVACK